MATIYGNTVNSRWRAYCNYSTSSNNTQTTLTAEACIQVNAYSVQYNGVSAGVSIDNTVNKSAKKGITKNYSAGTTYHSYVSASKTFTRGKSAATKYFSSWATFGPGSSSWQGTSNAYGSISVPAKPSYTVSYNANGGSGAPGNQTKWYGETLTLSSTKPARTGYSFQGWATSSGGSVAYASGASYTGNAALTLYAVWKANTYAITYNANGGSGAPAAQTKTYGQTLKLSSTVPTRANYNFKGWATSATGAVAYQPGANYTNNAAVTLYAVWEIAYIAPRITNVTADRCNSAGIYSEDGTYAKVTFNWATDEAVSSVKILCNGVTTTVSGQSGTSGSVSQVAGAGTLSTESEYSIVITVVDAKGQSTYTTSVAPLAYIMDYAPNGSVAIGTVADDSTRKFDVDIPTELQSGLSVNGLATFAGGQVNTGNLYMNSGRWIYFKDINNADNLYIGRANDTAGSLAIGAGSRMHLNAPYIYSNHICLRNNQAITAVLTSGSLSSILRMNTSNQVELTWTSGGLRGRVFKRIWSGTLTTGKITISELPYYNVLVLEGAAGQNRMFIGAINTARTYASFFNVSAAAGGPEVYSISANISGTSFDLTRNSRMYSFDWSITSNSIQIKNIYGLL